MTSERHRLKGDVARIYLRCDEATSRTQFSAEDEEMIARLLADKLMLELDGRLLALAVDVSHRHFAAPPRPGGHIAWGMVES